MRMTEWAEQEVKYAIEQEELEYNAACYKSALCAFRSLAKDGHSGFSMNATKNILSRLIDGKPLTPIEESDAIWKERWVDRYTGAKKFQCTRLFSLFKTVREDGTVSYCDIDRVFGRNWESSSRFQNGFLCNFVHKLFPITFPYMPEEKPYTMLVEEFLFIPGNGDFDTVGYLQLETPNGEVLDINRYFKDSDDSYIEITAEEYMARKINCVDGTLY